MDYNKEWASVESMMSGQFTKDASEELIFYIDGGKTKCRARVVSSIPMGGYNRVGSVDGYMVWEKKGPHFDPNGFVAVKMSKDAAWGVYEPAELAKIEKRRDALWHKEDTGSLTAAEKAELADLQKKLEKHYTKLKADRKNAGFKDAKDAEYVTIGGKKMEIVQANKEKAEAQKKKQALANEGFNAARSMTDPKTMTAEQIKAEIQKNVARMKGLKEDDPLLWKLNARNVNLYEASYSGKYKKTTDAGIKPMTQRELQKEISKTIHELEYRPGEPLEMSVEYFANKQDMQSFINALKARGHKAYLRGGYIQLRSKYYDPNDRKKLIKAGVFLPDAKDPKQMTEQEIKAELRAIHERIGKRHSVPEKEVESHRAEWKAENERSQALQKELDRRWATKDEMSIVTDMMNGKFAADGLEPSGVESYPDLQKFVDLCVSKCPRKGDSIKVEMNKIPGGIATFGRAMQKRGYSMAREGAALVFTKDAGSTASEMAAINRIKNDWYGRRQDIVDELRSAGFTVEQANGEYIIAVGKSEKEYVLYLGGTERTITIEKVKVF